MGVPEGAERAAVRGQSRGGGSVPRATSVTARAAGQSAAVELGRHLEALGEKGCRTRKNSIEPGTSKKEESRKMTREMLEEWLPTLKRNIKKNGGMKAFWKIAVGDFLHVGEIFPSSPWACQSVVKHLNGDKLVVEYGSGNGVLTRQILKALPQRAKLISIEVNGHFIPQLRDIEDDRLEVIHGDVLEVSQELRKRAPKGVDAVISGIPFTFITPSQRARVVQATHAALREGGRFIVYQNSKTVRPLLRSQFGRVDCFFEPRNIFPYFIMVAKRNVPVTHA
jgi:phospholipid N-methyltransferase